MDIAQLSATPRFCAKRPSRSPARPIRHSKRASRGGHHYFRKGRTTAHRIVPPMVFTAALPQGEPLSGRLNARSLFQRSSIVSSSA